MLGSDEGGTAVLPVAGVGAGLGGTPVAVGGVKPVGPKRRPAGKPPLKQTMKCQGDISMWENLRLKKIGCRSV